MSVLNYRIIITGGPGFGKSSIIRELERRGYDVFHEISREIIEEEKNKNGIALPWKDHFAFNEAVFRGRMKQYDIATNNQRLYFYDRGLPDSLAYLLADEKEIPADHFTETRIRPYFPVVYLTPPWKDIYCTDAQRWEDYSYATKIHDNIRAFYGSFGYEIIDIPLQAVDQRVNFILSDVASRSSLKNEM
jgi:predicted ATPase